MTGVPKSILKGLNQRDGHRSAWTGEDVETLVPQDRANRGFGGSSAPRGLSMYVWLESEINGLIESDAKWAAEARRRGIKISKFADPRLIPIQHAVHGEVYLDNEGGHSPADGIPKF